MNKKIKLISFLAFIFSALHSSGHCSYIVNSSDRAFFEEIKRDFATLDFESIGERISYPIKLVTGGKSVIVNDQEEFRQYVPQIIDSDLREITLKQEPQCLFKNWQGIMVGNGEMWFSEVMEEKNSEESWVYRIIAMNMAACR